MEFNPNIGHWFDISCRLYINYQLNTNFLIQHQFVTVIFYLKEFFHCYLSSPINVCKLIYVICSNGLVYMPLKYQIHSLFPKHNTIWMTMTCNVHSIQFASCSYFIYSTFSHFHSLLKILEHWSLFFSSSIEVLEAFLVCFSLSLMVHY